jgi:hypothetical protein
MTKGRSALLGACLALPLVFQADVAGAAQPGGGQYVYVPAGATVVVLPSAELAALPNQIAAVPVEFPVIGMFAQQDRMMRHMMADMDSLLATPMPDPQQLIRSVMQGMPQAAPGSGIVMTSMSSGNGVCSETITYGYPANGGAPQMKVTRSGSGCGAVTPSAPVGMMRGVPQPMQPAPAAPDHQRLWTIGFPPHPIVTGTPPRT